MKETISILYLTSDARDVQKIGTALSGTSASFRFTLASNENSFSYELDRNRHDIVLVDHELSPIKAEAVLEISLRQNSVTPVIVLANASDEDAAVCLLSKGANDYLLKDRLKRLPFAIAGTLKTARVPGDRSAGESNKEFSQLVETAQEGVVIVDEKGIISFASKKLGAILDCSVDEVIGKALESFMHPDDPKPFRLTESGQVECRLLTASGLEVWTTISFSPSLDESGSYKGALAMVTDITGHKLTEQFLRNSEANLRTILNSTLMAYILVSNSFEIILFNELADCILKNRDFSSFIKGTDVRNYFEAHRRSFIERCVTRVRSGETVAYEVPQTGRDGIVRWYDVKWVAVTDKGSANCGFIISARDISEAKTAAAEREKIIADLMQHNKQMQQFTYIVSHNLRAPVANIMGLSQALSDSNVNGMLRDEFVAGLLVSSGKLDEVIVDLNRTLEISRDHSESKTLVSLPGLLAGILSSLRDVIRKANACVTYDFSKAETITAIKSYLHSIFLNLISNGIKYRQPDLPPVIHIESFVTNDIMTILFRDNGLGIDLETKHDQVFGLYKRFHPHIEGKGMGLFMTRTQVEAMGGEISVKSKVNAGTEFKLELPYEKT